MKIYVDTSALVKYYGRPEFEKGTLQIGAIVSEAKTGKHIFFSSYRILLEAISTIDSWSRKRYISLKEKNEINQLK